MKSEFALYFWLFSEFSRIRTFRRSLNDKISELDFSFFAEISEFGNRISEFWIKTFNHSFKKGRFFRFFVVDLEFLNILHFKINKF
jgi:hypothetical protein